MKYVDEYRDAGLAKGLAAAIRKEADPDRTYNLMEFCGGHTHAIFRYGVQDLLPDNVNMVHGPGCPVCVLPIGRVDLAVRLATEHDVILCTYGDLLRVPGSHRRSLYKARAEGADVRMVYSTLDALKVARDNPDRQVVFFAIGFETTTPPTAVALIQAREAGLKNFSVVCNHVLTPAAMHGILSVPGEMRLDGFVGPAHVSAVIGSDAFAPFPRDFAKPVVIAGFEPLDVMHAVVLLIRQLNDGRCTVENEYIRVVTPAGNAKARALMAEVFTLRDAFEWRGLGALPNSALRIGDAFADFDAELRFGLTTDVVDDHPACACPEILRGIKRPTDCKIFGTGCTPDNPIGACMVSSEGACAAYYTYARFREPAATTTSTTDPS